MPYCDKLCADALSKPLSGKKFIDFRQKILNLPKETKEYDLAQHSVREAVKKPDVKHPGKDKSLM